MTTFDPLAVANLVASNFDAPPTLHLVQESGNHAVFEGGGAIVKVGGRDDLRAEAWAMDRARPRACPRRGSSPSMPTDRCPTSSWSARGRAAVALDPHAGEGRTCRP